MSPLSVLLLKCLQELNTCGSGNAELLQELVDAIELIKNIETE